MLTMSSPRFEMTNEADYFVHCQQRIRRLGDHAQDHR